MDYYCFVCWAVFLFLPSLLVGCEGVCVVYADGRVRNVARGTCVNYYLYFVLVVLFIQLLYIYTHGLFQALAFFFVFVVSSFFFLFPRTDQ